MTKKIKFSEAQADVKPAEELKPIEVTAENYAASCAAFYAGNGNRAYVVARKKGEAKDGFEFKASLHEWGAWRAWRIARKLPVGLMDAQGYYQVPTRWPEQFDINWSVEQSQNAGAKFFDGAVWERKDREKPLSERRQIVAAAFARTRAPAPYPPTDFPLGGRVYQSDRPTHPPTYGTVFYNDVGDIIDPPAEKHPKKSSFKRIGEK